MAVKAENKDIGDRATPQWTWTVGGTATDPTQIVVKQQDADGLETTVTTASSPATLTTASTPLARMSAGVFKLSPGIALSKQGYCLVRAESTGTAEAAAPDFLYKVGPSEFFSNAGLANWALVGLQETKDWLQQQNIGAPDDLELVRVINDISQLFTEEAEREFKNYDSTSSATVRMFDVDESIYYKGLVDIGDLSAAPTLVRVLAEDGTSPATIASTDYSVRPRVRKSWEPITGLQFKTYAYQAQPYMTVEVTGVWGFPSVPGKVRQAVLDAVAEVMDRDVEHYRQDLGAQEQGEGQNVIVVGSMRPSILTLPPRALAVAREYQRVFVG